MNRYSQVNWTSIHYWRMFYLSLCAYLLPFLTVSHVRCPYSRYGLTAAAASSATCRCALPKQRRRTSCRWCLGWRRSCEVCREILAPYSLPPRPSWQENDGGPRLRARSPEHRVSQGRCLAREDKGSVLACVHKRSGKRCRDWT